MHIFITAALVAIGMFSISSAHAARARICNKTIDYNPTGQQPSGLSGTWEGRLYFSEIATGCVGFAVIGMNPDGTILVHYVWDLSAGHGMNNTANLGDKQRNLYPVGNNQYVFKGPAIISVQMTAANKKLVGTWKSKDQGPFKIKYENQALRVGENARGTTIIAPSVRVAL